MKEHNYETDTEKQMTKKDLLAVMIAQFCIIMPWVLGFCLVLFGVLWLAMKYWG